jgi:phosphopantetheinyl transferase (holo-ACP synthase)
MRVLLLALLLTVASPSWAGIGTVSENKGTACEVERNKKKMSGVKGAEIESMDTYTTGACVSNITFKDDTKVKVTENSRLLIDDFVFDPKKSDAGKLALKVGMGTVRYASGQIAKNNPQQVNIKTPTATVAVRGTDFTMTVDETGQSLIVLVPSCKDDKDIKTYELEENLCKVGRIEVSTLSGTVVLDKAFEATYVTSANMNPTPPTVINTIEGKIGNNLIISKPMEIQMAIKEQSKTKQERELEEIEADAQRKISQRVKETNEEIENARILALEEALGKSGCNASTSVCVAWEKNDSSDIQSKGKGTAFRSNIDHYAEVKTTGYDSNTFVSISHNDQYAYTIVGSGDPGGNVVNIVQKTGVLRRP